MGVLTDKVAEQVYLDVDVPVVPPRHPDCSEAAGVPTLVIYAGSVA